MPEFTFDDHDLEPDKPSGDDLYLFRRLGIDETQLVPADDRPSAWKGIRYFKDEDWIAWALIGREDIVEEDDDPTMVSAEFAAYHQGLTDKWDENDGRKS